jgi:hypothetical protein
LFETNREINADLEDISTQKSTKNEIINVLSSFQAIGTEIKGITKNYAFLFSFIGAGLMVLLILI